MVVSLLGISTLSKEEQQAVCQQILESLKLIKQRSKTLSKQTENTSGTDLYSSRSSILDTIQILQNEINKISEFTAGSPNEYYSEHFATVYLWLSSMRVIREVKSFIKASRKIYNNQMDYLAREQQHFFYGVIVERCSHTSAAFQITVSGERDNTGQSFRNIVNQADELMTQITELLNLAITVGTSQLLVQKRVVTEGVEKLNSLLVESKIFNGRSVLDEMLHNIIVSAKDLAKKSNTHPVYASEEIIKVKERTVDEIFDLLVTAQQRILKYSIQGGSVLQINYRPPRPPRPDKPAPDTVVPIKTKSISQKIHRGMTGSGSVKQFATITRGLQKSQEQPKKTPICFEDDKVTKKSNSAGYQTQTPQTPEIREELDEQKPMKRKNRYKTLNDDQLQSFRSLKQKFKAGCHDLSAAGNILKKSPRQVNHRKRSSSTLEPCDLLVQTLLELNCLSPEWRTDEKLVELSETIKGVLHKESSTPELASLSEVKQQQPATKSSSVPNEEALRTRRTTSIPRERKDIPVVISKWKRSSESRANVLEQVQSQQIREVIGPLSRTTECFLQTLLQGLEGTKTVSEHVSTLYSYLTRIVDHTNDPKISSVFETSPLDLLKQAPLQGTKDEEIISNVANDRTIIGKQFLIDYKYSIMSMAKELQSLVIQLCWTLKAMLKGSCGFSQSFVVQILTFIYSIVDLITNLLNAQATSSYLTLHLKDVVDTEAPPERGRSSVTVLPDFWQTPAPTGDHDSEFVDGNLNQIIYQLVVPEKVDTARLQYFIITYKSITNPLELIRALTTCYCVPNGYFEESKVEMIQKRVCNLFIDWMSSQYLDLTPNILQHIEEFVDYSVLDVYTVKQLKGAVNQTKRKLTAIENAKVQLETDFSIESKMGRNTVMKSHAEHFLQADPIEIAEVLTYHDFEVFKAVKPYEFVEQCWSKPKYRHRAIHLHTVIKHLNKVSYWIPSLVLWRSSLNERAKLLTKIINIAEELRKLNNFSGVMALLAGINLACLFRLTFSFMAIGNATAEKLKKLQKLMDPRKSWKNYRTALKAASYPAVPYMGLYLSDLTQIYEGNDTCTGDTIHFEKQVRVGSIIREIQTLQSHPYKSLRVTEPLLTLISGLPVLDDTDLWELSLQREPRDSKIEDLLEN